MNEIRFTGQESRHIFVSTFWKMGTKSVYILAAVDSAEDDDMDCKMALVELADGVAWSDAVEVRDRHRIDSQEWEEIAGRGNEFTRVTDPFTIIPELD
jgi:hypothetical protein